MPTSFRAPFFVIKRNMGTWLNGVYKLHEDMGTQQVIMATIQMPSPGDHQTIEATPYGRRRGRYIKIYTDVRLRPVSQSTSEIEDEYPGDLIQYDARWYLIFGEADFTMLSQTRNTPVAHYRYYACETIEGANMEQAP